MIYYHPKDSTGFNRSYFLVLKFEFGQRRLKSMKQGFCFSKNYNINNTDFQHLLLKGFFFLFGFMDSFLLPRGEPLQEVLPER